MAKCLAPAMSVETRGRIGGLVFNTWRGVKTIKAKTAPAQPRSQKQLRLRALGITTMRLWQSISPTNRALWETYATAHQIIDWTGSPVRATGANWFLALNTRLRYHNDTPHDTPPVIAAPSALLNFAAADGAGSSILTWTSPLNDDLNAEIWIQGPHSSGAFGKIERAKWLINVSANAATTTVSGLLAGRYTFWCRAYNTTNGLVSTYLLDTADIT